MAGVAGPLNSGRHVVRRSSIRNRSSEYRSVRRQWATRIYRRPGIQPFSSKSDQIIRTKRKITRRVPDNWLSVFLLIGPSVREMRRDVGHWKTRGLRPWGTAQAVMQAMQQGPIRTRYPESSSFLSVVACGKERSYSSEMRMRAYQIEAMKRTHDTQGSQTRGSNDNHSRIHYKRSQASSNKTAASCVVRKRKRRSEN
jgi:hypothetical protein